MVLPLELNFERIDIQLAVIDLLDPLKPGYGCGELHADAFALLGNHHLTFVLALYISKQTPVNLKTGKG